QADGQENSAEEFHAGNEHRHLRGHWEIQAGEKFRDLGQIMQLAPAALDQLPAPVQADGQEKRRAQVVDGCEEALVQMPQTEGESFHGRSEFAPFEKSERSEQKKNRLVIPPRAPTSDGRRFSRRKSGGKTAALQITAKR